MYLPTKFGVRSFIRSTVMEGIPNFTFRSRDSDHAHFRGQSVVHWLEHEYREYESNWTRHLEL